jgi:hypothetical protein
MLAELANLQPKQSFPYYRKCQLKNTFLTYIKTLQSCIRVLCTKSKLEILKSHLLRIAPEAFSRRMSTCGTNLIQYLFADDSVFYFEVPHW